MKLDNGLEIIDTTYRTAAKCICIVLCRNSIETVKAYMSPVEGFNEKQDMLYTASWGVKLTKQEAEAFFRKEIENYEK